MTGLIGNADDSDKALDRLATAIGLAAATCAESIDAAITAIWEEEQSVATHRFMCNNEYLFFFMHYVNRLAYSRHGQDVRSVLQKEIGPRVIGSTIEATVGHWPEDRRSRIMTGLWSGLNEREVQFGRCHELWIDPTADPIVKPDGTPASPESVVNVLVVNLSENVLGGRMNAALYKRIVDHLLDTLKAANFESLVAAAGARAIPKARQGDSGAAVQDGDIRAPSQVPKANTGRATAAGAPRGSTQTLSGVHSDAVKTIWFNPRKTIRAIVQTDVTRHVYALAIAGAFFNGLNQASNRSLGDSLSVPLLLLFVGALSLLSIPALHIGGAVAQWLGGRLGGRATREQVRAAIAWSSVPILVWSCIAWPLQFVAFGSEVFVSDTPRMDAMSPSMAIALLVPAVVARSYLINVEARSARIRA